VDLRGLLLREGREGEGRGRRGKMKGRKRGWVDEKGRREWKGKGWKGKRTPFQNVCVRACT